jgi:flagellar hook assembly protein FlgD/outer membrane protein OmpA-like peptidoglycan-associated protein
MAEDVYPSGADLFPDLYAPRFLGEGAFVTQQGGAEEMAVNPASGGDAQRMVFDAGYTGILGEDSVGSFINLGALFPTKFAVFGGSARLVGSPSPYFLGEEGAFLINAAAAKELYPGMNAGIGFNMGIGSGDWANLSLDLGFRYNMGKRGPVENFTWAIAARSLGLSYAPSAFTLVGGVSADVLHLKAKAAGKADPLVVTALLDVSFPSFQNFTGKLGVSGLIAGIVTVSTSWGFNVKELADRDIREPMLIPSVGLGVHFALKSTGNRIAGGSLPTDGDISIATGVKPLYHGIWAAGGGVTWAVGVVDNAPPLITAGYPETAYISPNNDGEQDALEFPITITDQRHITQWVMEVQNAAGETVRTYRNKERRIETQGFWEVVKRIQEVKGGVVIPESLRWDGTYEDGQVVPDGSYFFVVRAKDDNDNEAETQRYEVVVDNTPPVVQIDAPPDANKIFSPDGDGNKDTFSIGLSGSVEDFWDAGLYDAAGNKVKRFDFAGTAPSSVIWDGLTDDGSFAPDGVYSFRIAATDKAANHDEAALSNIVVSTIQPEVHISLSDAYLSPNGDGVKDTVGLNFDVPVTDGITGWRLDIRDSAANALRRTFSGTSPAPVNIDYDGRDNAQGVLPEGSYRAEFSVTYRNGFVSTDTSPLFTVDVTPPLVSARAGYEAFSPNNDGVQDEMPVTQAGSNEVLWRGEVRNAANPEIPPVRVFRFAGTPPSAIQWDGHTDAGALVPDGQYVYALSATDRAGNFATAQTQAFTLSTADTSIMLSTDLRAFSPNGDRVQDTVNLVPQIKSRDGIASWQVEVLDAQGTAVRTFTGNAAAPQNIAWDGKTGTGTAAPDGQYTARISLVYAQGDRPSAQTRPFVLDTAAPNGAVNAAYTLFSPNGDGKRDSLPLGVTTTGDDTWEAAVMSAGANGAAVKTWNWTGTAPDITWDGSDTNGNLAANGTYRFLLASTDEAGNTTRREVQTITLDARTPRVFFTGSGTAIAPKPGSNAEGGNAPGSPVTFTPVLSFSDGIESWEFALKDAAGNTVKSFTNRTENRYAPGASIIWDGLDNSGTAREGLFTPTLTVVWTKGDTATAESDPVRVDVSGPVLDFVTSPEFFSPDNDDVDDELFIALGITDASPVASWSLDIREPQTNRLFYHIEGKGMPAGRLIWDGRSNTMGGVTGGELVQAASDYPYTFKAADSLGNESALDGIIGIDVLVIRDGDNLKIAVPSIQFRSNAADFDGLPAEVIATNNRVLTRVAQILNKFREYKVTVEGHANPTTLPGPAREREESTELVPLSEQRAHVVVDILVKNGVARSRLSSTGVGGRRTVAAWNDENNRWKNRRVEFILIK